MRFRLCALPLLCSLFLSIPVFAGRPPIDDAFFQKHLRTTRYPLDTAASAVVLYEAGSAEISPLNFQMVRSVRRVIQVLRPGAVSVADVSVSTFTPGRSYARVQKVRGTTYNLGQDGKMVATPMDRITVQRVEQGNSVEETRFSLPAVRAGSIIDYSFEIDEDLAMLMAEWNFQAQYPTLYSEFRFAAPAPLTFATLRQGGVRFSNVSTARAMAEGLDSWTETENSVADMQSHIWVRRNVPGAEPEPHSAYVENFTQRIELKFTGFKFRPGQEVKMLDSWEKVNDHLFDNTKFYGRLRGIHARIDKKSEELTAGVSDSLEKARRLFRYVRDDMRCTNDGEGIFCATGLDEVMERRTGSGPELNLLLVTLLRKAGLRADPLVYSDRESLRPTKSFVTLARFNRTACRLQIGSSTYLLDASGKENAFGRLPASGYNGYARVVNKAGEELDLSTEQLADRSAIMLMPDGAGSDGRMMLRQQFGAVEAAKLRAAWRKEPERVVGYLESIASGLPLEASVLDHRLAGLSDPDSDLVLTATMTVRWPANGGTVLLQPAWMRAFPDNPFRRDTRVAPVEMPATLDRTFSLNLYVPEGYEPEALLPPTRVVLDEKDEFKHNLEYNAESRLLKFTSRLRMRRAVFAAEEYDLLKIFVEKTMEEEAKPVVLKKKA